MRYENKKASYDEGLDKKEEIFNENNDKKVFLFLINFIPNRNCIPKEEDIVEVKMEQSLREVKNNEDEVNHLLC